ncbi:hypothetical protein [Acuticoccus yangtzensis]|uniref:hypothetical protein n=1 Tax=Acuticoccus yangtzensis TaxID=1443441 RepID=UPI0009495C05|nr:hypothetical protein [Acuticoccus yangtzensis]ORE90931.1 hypothetical protein ATO13_21641 [Stappia sp. 22II-S9-Z10]
MDLWWFRMVMWARRRPSRQMMLALVGVAILVAVVMSIEAAGLWPDWATADRVGRRGPGIHATPVE